MLRAKGGNIYIFGMLFFPQGKFTKATHDMRHAIKCEMKAVMQKSAGY